MKHRLFIAIDVPDSCRTEVITLQNQLDKLGLPVIWENPQKLHLTLHFLGPTPQEQMVNLYSQLNKFAASQTIFNLTPYFLETLYRRHDPSLIYLGLNGDVLQLKKVQEDMGEVLRSIRLPSQNRYLPHIKIGEFKRDDPNTTKDFLNKVEEVEFSPLATFTVDHFSLYESFVSASGSHYQKIGHYKVQ